MAGISKAERERRAAEDAAAAASATQAGDGWGDRLQDAGPALVHMTRDAIAHPAPHTAEVHPAEVDNYAAGGWQLPAVPFRASITPGGKCKCFAPQVCDE